MNDGSNEKVTRYCPECKSKFIAEAEEFAKPRVCPKCRTRVYFIDYVRVRPELPEDLAELVDSGISMLRPTVQIPLLVGVTAMGLGFTATVISGNSIAMFAAAGLMFCVGIAAIAMFLDFSGRTNDLRAVFKSTRTRAQELVDQQTRLVHQLRGLQINFDTIVEQELTSIRNSNQTTLNEAEWDRAQAASELASVQEYVSRAKDEAKEEIAQYEKAAAAIAHRYLSEVRKGIRSKLNSDNYHRMLETYERAVEFCGKKGYPVDGAIYESVKAELKEDYAEAVRKEIQRAEQQRIREQIREEQKAQREIDREMKRLAAEQAAIEKALAEALARTHDEHSAEVQELRRKLAEAEEKGRRALSMAQQTKAGFVYVISNIGSFGNDVFKIGMSRRLEPLDRVKELSGASVPFPFDVHMMLSSDNAPKLETELHRAFHAKRMNRVNLRKEFFNVTIDEIVGTVESLEGEVSYVADPEALQYHESLEITPDEFEMISKSYESEAETA